MNTPPPDQRYRSDPLTAAQRELASDPAVIRAAQRIAERASRHRPSLLADELLSASLLAVVQAARTFDPDSGSCWKTHATNRVRGAIKDAVRDWYGGRNHWHMMQSRSLDEAIATDGDTFAAFLADDSMPVGHEIERDDNREWLARQAGASRYPVVRLLLRPEQLTHREVATLLGMSESNVSRTLTLAAATLRERHGASLAEIGGAA
jgi:RNA polymerase sigma factor (sigma-70 family)